MAAKAVSLIRREIEVVMRRLSHLCTKSCRLGNVGNDAGHIHCVGLYSILTARSHPPFLDSAVTLLPQTLTMLSSPSY